jgi:hypothetical protein
MMYLQVLDVNRQTTRERKSSKDSMDKKGI